MNTLVDLFLCLEINPKILIDWLAYFVYNFNQPTSSLLIWASAYRLIRRLISIIFMFQ